jgi:hypothetical protein
VILDYRRKYPKNHVFIETGTAHGPTTAGVAARFSRVFTIDIAEDNYQNAIVRFMNQPHITPVHGDSGVWLQVLMQRIQVPSILWLDAHYDHDGREDRRGEVDTPIREELSHALHWAAVGHLVLVDDARLFGSDEAYPTIDEVQRRFAAPSGYGMIVEDDIIRLIPPGGAA